MTRLSTTDISNVASSMYAYDSDLINKTGCSLGQIANTASGCKNGSDRLNGVKVAVIPVTTGKGLIKGFCESVKAIADYLGCRAFITVSTDVGGLTEAFSSGADVAMMADDHMFVAINLSTRKVVDNAVATAKGYVAALEKMAGGLYGKQVVLIGAGRVGSSAAKCLSSSGAKLIIFDIDRAAESDLVQRLIDGGASGVSCSYSLDQALKKSKILFDASPGRAFITAEHVGTDTLVAAPGLPLGLNTDALQKISRRLIHDPLQIGVATMLFEATRETGGLS